MKESREALDKIISNVALLARQVLAIRGHTDKTSNLSQFLKVRGTYVSHLSSWLQRTKYKWIWHEIINELLEMIAPEIIRVITAKIKKVKYFSIMLDETSDISVMEQVSSCVRSVRS